MADLLQDVIDHIISNNEATAKDTDIFKDYSPDTPDDCVIVYEYAGSGTAAFEPVSVRSVQIVVRSKNSQSAKQHVWDVFKLLSPETGIMFFGDRVCIIANRNTPIKIGVDEKQRYLYAFSMGITTNFD